MKAAVLVYTNTRTQPFAVQTSGSCPLPVQTTICALSAGPRFRQVPESRCGGIVSRVTFELCTGRLETRWSLLTLVRYTAVAMIYYLICKLQTARFDMWPQFFRFCISLISLLMMLFGCVSTVFCFFILCEY